MAITNNIQCVVLLFVCCLVLHLNCYVINTDGEQPRESLLYEGKNNETAAKKCIRRSNCIRDFGSDLCDALNIVCSDSDPNDENSSPSTDYTDYFYTEKDVNSNVTFYPYDHSYRTYSHISPSTWGYLIMIKIFIIVFLRIFCCNYRRSTVMFIPTSSPGLTCHGISNPMSAHRQHQQEMDSSELSRCPLTTQHEMPTVVVESSRQKDDSPPPPYPAVVSTETLPPPDYNTLFPRAQTSSSSPPLSS